MKLPNTAAQLFRGSVIGDIQFQRLSFAKLCGPTLRKKCSTTRLQFYDIPKMREIRGRVIGDIQFYGLSLPNYAGHDGYAGYT